MDPYKIVLHRHVSEKTVMLSGLKDKQSNPSLARFQQEKWTFRVALNATKIDIARAIEAIYAEKHVQVDKVNTSIQKPKPKSRGRFHGKSRIWKKAVVTFKEGQSVE